MKEIYIGICLHSAGLFQADEVEVEAESVQQAHGLIWAELFGSRYVSRIVRLRDKVTVWKEGETLDDHA